MLTDAIKFADDNDLHFTYNVVNCHYCKEELGWDEVTKDHVFPKSKIRKLVSSGQELPDELDLHKNKVFCCEPCNQLKGNKDYDSFMALGVKQIKHLKKLFLMNQNSKKRKHYKHKRR